MKTSIETIAENRETHERIAKAIAFMQQNYRDRPDLKTVAEQVHLSESYFQRLFTKWAGISPKRFLQNLTVERAKSKIASAKNLLDLTEDVGLSSPGRLHDLFVSLEAMSPGEFKVGGVGLQIRYGVHQTPFGNCLIATTARGICNLHFLDGDEEAAEGYLKLEWPEAEILRDPQATQKICDRIFDRVANRCPTLVLHVKGTNFQIQVWRALLRVPFGDTTTYGSLAQSIGKPTAARAVGNAVGQNPVGYIIPCHRVIRESGEMGGYRWGVERKAVLLDWEARQNQNLHPRNLNRKLK